MARSSSPAPASARARRRALAVVLAALVLCGHGSEGPLPTSEVLAELSPEEQDHRAADDVVALAALSRAARRIKDDIARHQPLFDKDPEAVLTADERVLLLGLYEAVLAHVLAFEHLASFHYPFWQVQPLADPRRHAQHYVLAYAAFTEQLDLALAFVAATVGKKQFETLLDEGVDSLGLGPGTYGQLKWKSLAVDAMTRLVAGFQYHRLMVTVAPNPGLDDPVLTFCRHRVEQLYPQVMRNLRVHGVDLFLKNSADLVADSAWQAWFPLQTTVAVWLGQTRVVRGKDTFLITSRQVEEITRQSQPGDLVFIRRDWFASNLAMPGYWSHIALYLGTVAELHDFFDHEPEVTRAFGLPFTEAMAVRHPHTWRHFTLPDDDGQPHRFIEAVGAGVILSSATHALRADHAAGVRPRLSKVEIARAVDRALTYYGRPYDYDFDFFSDTSLVCTELIYKAYEPREGVVGLRLPLQVVAGRTTLVPNLMVQRYDATADEQEQQLDFLWFLDGEESLGEARWATRSDFRESWKRIKWTVAR